MTETDQHSEETPETTEKGVPSDAEGPEIPESNLSEGPDEEELEVTGLEEELPESLMPLYHGYERVMEIREEYGRRYVSVLEAILGILLIGGYFYWLYLFFIAG